MTVIFPKNNLPEPAQPWAREVQKQLANVISSDQANEINNSARDNQLNSSLISLTKVVSDVKVASAEATAAINGLTGLGSSGSSYSINASNITGGTITGVTLQTASSGQRITLGGTTLDFYSPNGSFSGRISQDGGDAVPSVRIYSADTNNYFQISNDAAFMRGSGSTISAFSGQIFLVSNLVNTSSAFTSGGTFTASSTVFMPNLGTDSSAANMRVGTGGAGQVFRSTASSRMFKNSIIPITQEIELDPKKLLEIPVVAFKYNEDYLRREDTRFDKMIPGFIAEDMKEIYPIAIEQDGGDATDWNPRYVVPSMLALIQELYTRIQTLENGA